MKDIKKYMTLLAAAGVVMAVSVPSHAAFTTKGTQTLSASATTGGTPTIAITSALVKNRSNGATVGALGWTNTAAGWQVSDQYIELATNINTVSGGVQIYMDNKNSVPPYSGVISSNTQSPAGLVSNADTTQRLPTAWRSSTFTLTAVNPINPNANSGESFLWFFHEDKSQVANVQNGADFVNADPFITVYAAPGTTLTSGATLTKAPQSTTVAGGNHFAQDPASFGGFQSVATTIIYTEADFSSALAQTSYNTTKLILEAFSL